MLASFMPRVRYVYDVYIYSRTECCANVVLFRR